MPNDLYNDLPLTNFPNDIDTFTTWLNIVATDGPLIQQYQAAMQAGNTTQANQILAQIPQGTQKIITATDLNKLTQAIQAVERFYKTDIQPYIETQQESWLTTIQKFSYQGVWSSNTSYVTNNFVSYSVSGLTLIYLAISDPPLGTPPTNQTYWRLLTIQGQQGASGAGLSYRQQWSASQAYSTNDAVTYDGGLYMALQNSTNQNPATATSYWKLVMALEATVYPIQDTQPTTQDVGGLWFNTQSNPTQYYYLETLTNPATASEIVYGQEAYDEMGNLIVGTLPVPISIAVTTNPTQMSYIVGQSFNPAGMVVTATYSDGSQSTVSGYTYSPTGALTLQDTPITIQYIENGVTVDTTLAITVTNPIYGAIWDGTSTTAWTRTDGAANFPDPQPSVNNGPGSSPFDDIMPWSGMQKISDPEAGILVSIPKYWYKWTKSGNSLQLQISQVAQDGFYVSPAHCDRGDGAGERDVVYVGRYHCHTSGWKSRTGGRPKSDITRSSARSSIHNLGGTIWQWDWAMNWTIKMLYLVEFADWNSQTKIGYGCGNDSSTENMGATDGMTYHTGTSKSSRTTYGVGVQYRHIEGLWDNVYDWVDGCYYASNGLNIILNPNNFSDSSGGTSIGTPTSGFPSALDIKTGLNNQWPLPTARSGSDSTYVPDVWYFGASGPCLFVGGDYSQNLRCGLFCVQYVGDSITYVYVGSRLMKLPNNT